MRSITITYLQFQLYSIVIATCHKKQQWSSHVLGLYWFWHLMMACIIGTTAIDRLTFDQNMFDSAWFDQFICVRHLLGNIWSSSIDSHFSPSSLSLSFLFKTLRSNSTNLIRQKLKKKLHFWSNCIICLAKDLFSFQKER